MNEAGESGQAAPSARRTSRQRGSLIVLVLLVVAAAALAVPYLAGDGETTELTDELRGTLDGAFIPLEYGVTHLQVGGPLGEPIVVLIHGFSTPYFIWDETFKALTEAGFRVLRYDLYGRGYTDRPNWVDYNAELFDGQLVELLDRLEVDEPVALVGLSMGGAIATIFTDRHPERVAALVLVDPAGYPIEMGPLANLVRMPGVGEYLMRVLGDRSLLDQMESNFYDKTLAPAFRDRFADQMQYRGFKSALLSTLRHMPLNEQEATYRRVGEMNKPTLLVWGEQDEVIPFETHEKVLEAIPHAEFLPVPECGHTPVYEKPEAVLPELVQFLVTRPDWGPRTGIFGPPPSNDAGRNGTAQDSETTGSLATEDEPAPAI